MLIDFVAKNVVSLILFFGCMVVLIGISIYSQQHRRTRYSFILHLVKFALWSSIVIISGNYVISMIDDFKLRFLTPGMINFICTLIIAIMLLRKVFLMINILEKQQVKKGSDITSARMISRVLKISIVVVMILLYGEHIGMSLSGLLTFGGIGGIAVGMAGKDILSNFFSGIMLYFDRPFNIGDWIRSPDRNIEGTVMEIGWRLTKIMTFDNRPLYVPNSVFTALSVENPGRMTNRRIETTLGLRYEDTAKIAVITEEIRAFLQADADIDQRQVLLVYFNGFGESSLNIMVYCFTKTTVWSEWLAIQQRVYLKFIEIVHQHDADFAFPSRTLYMDNGGAERAAVPRNPPA